MIDSPRYMTLRDYLRVLRAQWWLIALCTLLFGMGAYLYVSRQERTYAAETSLAFTDLTDQLLPLDPSPGDARTPAQERVAVKAETVTRPEVLERLRKRLHTRLSIDRLQSAITARPEARTNLLVVEARSANPRFAARLANGFALTVQAMETKEQRARLRRAAASIRREMRRAAAREPLGSSYVRALEEQTISRLGALESFGRPVEIARRAEVSDTPVSPHAIRDTLLGALIGLALGLLLAFARDALDVRLRTPRHVQTALDLPLLGQVPRSVLGKAPAKLNGHGGPGELESFQIIRANLDFLDPRRPIRTVAVTSATPQEGKSTVAAALAHAAAAVGRRTLLVECDLRQPSLAGRLGIESRPGLSDHLVGAAEAIDVMQPVAMPESALNGAGGGSLACVVAGGKQASPSELFASSRFRDFLGLVARTHDLVLLDCGPLLPVADTLELMPQVDALVLCVRESRTTRDRAQAARSTLERFPEKPVGLVVTGVSRRESADYYGYAEAGVSSS
jgi:capsular exopolysaccharide synthesis family protein